MQRVTVVLTCGARKLSQSSVVLQETRTVNELGKLRLEAFRNEAFALQHPAVGQLEHMPAMSRWFTFQHGKSPCLNERYLTNNGIDDIPVCLEVTRASSTGEVFETINAPLSAFCSWTNATANKTRSEQVYLAQNAVSDLPSRLQRDLPVPSIVKEAGNGDIYGSSIWIGLAPTNTPLHRDPNPNLLMQLAGEKVVRLYEPDVGAKLFAEVRSSLGFSATSRFRGSEMMAGQEKQMLDEVVWRNAQYNPLEVRLRPTDALFIPLGWWHSVKGIGNGVSASVNWWFR